MTEQLAAAWAAEQAAIFGYGPVGVRLTGAAASAARAAEAAHRDRRDTLLLRLSRLGVTAPPAPPGYALPFPVTDATSALRLAIRIEEGTAAAWRAALATTDDADRRFALAALTDCALRATRWRTTAGVAPVTVPFPGRS